MAAVKETVYIKADQNVEVRNRDVTLGDILSMECTDKHVLAKLKTVKILKIPDQGEHRYVVSVLKIIACIHKEYPNLEVQNMGAPDIIVTYENQQTPGKFVHFLKVVVIAAIVFMGAAYSIMSFNNDTNAPKLFEQIYQLVMGKQKSGFSVLELSYCIGLGLGILVFFNHFGKKNFSVDPTPLEVEMRLYENDIQTTLIETYSRKEQEEDVGKTTSDGGHRT